MKSHRLALKLAVGREQGRPPIPSPEKLLYPFWTPKTNPLRTSPASARLNHYIFAGCYEIEQVSKNWALYFRIFHIFHPTLSEADEAWPTPRRGLASISRHAKTRRNDRDSSHGQFKTNSPQCVFPLVYGSRGREEGSLKQQGWRAGQIKDEK